MDTQWHQELGLVKPMENNNNNGSSSNFNTSNLISSTRRERPQKEQANLNCPRCKSTHTKFCYYNNYSLTQPRYHCKTCRRYWTEGGSLRNVPIGGGSRKNKKISSSSSSSSNLNTLMSYIAPMSTTITSTSTITKQNPNQDLNFAFTTANTNTNSTTNPPNVLNLLESGSRTMINPFMPIVQNYESGFGLHEFRSTRFALDGATGSVNEGNIGGGRMLFPFEETRQGSSGNNNVSNGSDRGDNRFEQKGFWTSMMGGGGSW